MNVTAIIFAAVVVGGVGILIGFFLGVSGEKFKVEVDEREVAVTEALPGNNCGGCGYAGCSGLAAAIVKGEAPVNQCPVGGAPVAAKIGEIMGVKAEEGERKAAFVKCAGTCEKAKLLISLFALWINIDNFLIHRSSGLCRYGICSKWWTKIL